MAGFKLYHIVAAAGETRVIGKDNALPWPKISADLRHFKKTTDGSTLIMGRKTFESIGSKPLPGRENFVLSQANPAQEAAGVRFFDSLGKAFAAISTPKAFVIGGGDLFRQTLPIVDGIYFTQIHAAYEGDTFYPEIPASFRKFPLEILQQNPRVEIFFFDKYDN